MWGRAIGSVRCESPAARMRRRPWNRKAALLGLSGAEVRVRPRAELHALQSKSRPSGSDAKVRADGSTGAWFAAASGSRAPGAGRHATNILVPVPLHPQRQRDRGYNQAHLVARPLLSFWGCRTGPLLMRRKPRPEKQLLSLEERWHSPFGPWRFCHAPRQLG
jgi:hypothetical protein